MLTDDDSDDVTIKMKPAMTTVNNKNSSGDEIANMNFLRDIVHVEASAYAH